MTNEQFKEMIKQMDYMTSELTENSLSNQRCDFTGWSLTEAMSNIALEMRESNNIKREELALRKAEFEFKQQTTKY